MAGADSLKETDSYLITYSPSLSLNGLYTLTLSEYGFFLVLKLYCPPALETSGQHKLSLARGSQHPPPIQLVLI